VRSERRLTPGEVVAAVVTGSDGVDLHADALAVVRAGDKLADAR
jgi:hypothetical protein